MRVFALLPIAMLCLAGCVSSGDRGRVAPFSVIEVIPHQGVEYRRITGADLVAAIVGSTKRSLDIISSGDNDYYYGSDGQTYWNGGHRAGPVYGTYEVTDESVCHHFWGNRWCEGFFRSDDGAYVVMVVSPVTPYNGGVFRVRLTPGVPAIPTER